MPAVALAMLAALAVVAALVAAGLFACARQAHGRGAVPPCKKRRRMAALHSPWIAARGA